MLALAQLWHSGLLGLSFCFPHTLFWHWYDCTDYALNLFNCPTVAYSGEIDRQKQAADMMARALSEEGIELTHQL